MTGIEVSSLDIIAFAAYFGALLLIGVLVSRTRKNEAADYFLAGRSLPWYVVGSSYIAANISTEHFIGLVGAAFIYGICVATGEWSSVIAFTFLIWLYIPFLMKSRVYTAPEFLEKRFNRTIRIYFALVTLVLNVFGFLGPILYGGGLVLDSLFGLDLTISIIIIGLGAGFWAVWGGLRTIASIDVLTIVVMVVGGLSVTVLGLLHLGEGAGLYRGFERMLIANEGIPQFAGKFISDSVPHILKDNAPGDPYSRLSVIQPLNHYAVPWTHWILSFFYIGLWYTVINQHMIQKVLAAKDIYHARMGMILASLLKLLLPLIVVFPGLIFFAMNPVSSDTLTPTTEEAKLIDELGLSDQLEQKSHILDPSSATLIVEMREGPEVVAAAHRAELGLLPEAEAVAAKAALSELRFNYTSKLSNQTYIQMVGDIVPKFWMGLLMAALFGSIQSTVGSVINSTSTVFTMDIYRIFIRPNATESQEVLVGRFAGIVVLVLSIVSAVLLAELSQINLFVYIQSLFVFFAPPFSAIFLVGSLWCRVSGRDAVAATIGAVVFAIALKFMEFGFPEYLPGVLRPFANQGAIVWLVAMVIVIVSAMLTPPPAKEQTSKGLVVRLNKVDLMVSDEKRIWYQSVTFWWVFCVVFMFLLIAVFSFVL